MGTILMPGGGGGIDLDVVTAAAGDILSGKVIVGADGEPLTGTLALTGNAGTGDVLSGKTFYNDDAKTKRSGTMANRGTLNWSGINTTKSVDAGYYSGGILDSRPSYNSGRTQGQNDVKNSPNSYSLYTKAQYDANYNNGLPNTANLSAWYRDDTTAHTWTCGTAGYYLIFAYGFVNATRHVTPTVTCNGTKVGDDKVKKQVPIWEKVTLTLEEAAEYSNIGINKIRELSNNPRCNFVIFVGKKRLIKRKEFEKYIFENVEL